MSGLSSLNVLRAFDEAVSTVRGDRLLRPRGERHWPDIADLRKWLLQEMDEGFGRGSRRSW